MATYDGRTGGLLTEASNNTAMTLRSPVPGNITFAPGITIDGATGKVTIPEGLTLDDAALAFWHAVERHFPGIIKREDRK